MTAPKQTNKLDTPTNELDHESDYALLLEEAYQLGVFNTKDGCLIPVIEKLQSLINKLIIEELESLPISDYEDVSEDGDETWFEYISLDDRDKLVAKLRTTK